MPEQVSVVILNWNGQALLERFLPSVRKHSGKAVVIVADNGSSDGSLEMLRDRFPEVRIIAMERNYGFAEGYNRALEEVDTTYTVLLNNDVEVTNGWLDTPLAVMNKDERVAAVQPKILSERERGHFEYAGAAGGYIDRYGYPFCRGRLLGEVEEDTGQYDSEAEVAWASGACLFVRTATYKKEGGLDQRFFAHQEEIDLCWRLRNRGYRVVCTPQSVIYHVGGGTLQAEKPYKTFLNFRNNLLMLYKNLPEEDLQKVMGVRKGLDMLAGIHYALSGQWANALAVWKAWRAFGHMRSDYSEVRKENGKRTTIRDIRWKGCLLYQYYVRRKKRFAELGAGMLGLWLLGTGMAWGQEQLGRGHFEMEAWAAGGTGKVTPFWMVSNRYGVAPLRARNGYLRGKAEYEDTWGKNVHWKTGVDVAVTPREKKIHVQQAYGELQYRGWEVIAGAKERYISLWDKELSSGDMIQSGNARPAPGLFISRPQFSSVPLTGGWLQWKGEFGVSLFVDGKYLAASTPENAYYVKHVRRHDKSLFLRLSDQQKHFPLYATAGLRHTAQWAGISTHPEYGGKQPHSFVDFLRIVMAQPGGDGASTPDRENVLGAHHMAYDMQLGYEQNDWAVQLYHQHIAGDKSGTELNNGIDGLWGIRGDLPCKWLRKMVIEYVTTRHQSGPFHFLWFDREKYPARGGGGDNYYNNGVYVNGHAHFGRSEGSPLLPSPEYNEDGRQGFLNTRILDWHIGLEGALAPTTSYRLLCTLMNGWGTSEEPFLQKKTGLSFLLETNYTFPQYPLSLIASLAGDTGDVFGLPAYAASLSLRWIVL